MHAVVISIISQGLIYKDLDRVNGHEIDLLD